MTPLEAISNFDIQDKSFSSFSSSLRISKSSFALYISAFTIFATSEIPLASLDISTNEGNFPFGVFSFASASKLENLCILTKSKALHNIPLAGSVAWCE